MIKFGHFDDLCYRAVLPICNLFNKTNATQYRLEGFSVGDTQITNLGKLTSMRVGHGMEEN